MNQNQAKDIEIEGMETNSSLPAKVEEVELIQPLEAEIQNQKTGEFQKVMISPEEVRKFLCPTATLPELYIFMSICRHQGIDPVSEAYFIKYEGTPGFTVMKYTVYLKRALKSGVLKSIRHEFDDEDNPTKIMVFIERNDIEGQWVWTTYRNEVEQHRKRDGKITAIWQKQPRFQLVKCGYSQGLRFFCADVVGALPPVEEEMTGIPALNMPSLGSLPPAETVEGEQVTGEVLEVKDVQPLAEHLDMSPLRHTYFGMIDGMFKDDAERKKWQLENTDIESARKWGPEQYGKAFKRLSQEAGPPKGLDLERIKADEETLKKAALEEQISKLAPDPEKEKASETAEETVPAEVKDAVDQGEDPSGYLRTVRARYIKQIEGRFATPEEQESWQASKLGNGDIDFWYAQDFIRALAILDELDKNTEPSLPNGKLHSPLLELRAEYVALLEGVFEKPLDRDVWQGRVVGISDMNQWDLEHWKTAIQELKDYKKLDPAPRQFHDLKLEYEELIFGRFADPEAQIAWQKAASGKTGDREQWGITHYQMAITAIAAELTPAKSTVRTDDMKSHQFTELREIVVQLPKYNKNLGSKEFRDRAAEITGRRPRGIKTYTVEETGDIILELRDELQDFLTEAGKADNPAKEFDFSKE